MINLIENLCRTCMGEEETVYFTTPNDQSNKALFSIFNGPRQTMDRGSITIKELLKQATPQLSINKDDLLPKSVCKNCLDKLVNIHQFQQKCLLSEQRLKDLMNESTISTCVMDNEDDPLTNIKITEDFTDLHNILKIELDEPIINENAKNNNDILIAKLKDDSANVRKDDGEQFQSNDIISRIKPARNRKSASRDKKIDNPNESTDPKYKSTDCYEKLFVCNECGSSLKSLKSLKRHEKIHNQPKIGRRRLKKRECHFDDYDKSEEEAVELLQLDSAISQTSSGSKIQEVHENNDLKNKQVGAATSDLDETQLEIQDDMQEKSFACEQCGCRLKTRQSLNRHLKIHQRTLKIEKNEPEEPECIWHFGSGEDSDDEDYDPHDTYDNDETNSKKRFKNKITASKDEKEKTQKIMNQHDSIDPDLRHPILADDKPFECDECGSRVKTRKSLKRHKRIHLRLPGERAQRSKTKYECKYCQKVFCQSSSLKDHMRVHTGEKPFLCSECGKAFKILSNMKQHFLRHGTDRPYECPDCPKKFPCLTDLASHAAVHNKAKTHVCDICGSAFVKPYLLKKHKMYHTGEKNHKCDYCDMRFVLAEQCRRHMRTHTGEKPYKCKYCSRAFAQSNDLTKHLRVHLGDSVYKCDMCPQGFRLLGDLRAHFNTHKNDDEDTRLKNLQALKEDELRLQLRFGLVQTTENIK